MILIYIHNVDYFASATTELYKQSSLYDTLLYTNCTIIKRVIILNWRQLLATIIDYNVYKWKRKHWFISLLSRLNNNYIVVGY